jgi:hypothetical protein
MGRYYTKLGVLTAAVIAISLAAIITITTNSALFQKTQALQIGGAESDLRKSVKGKTAEGADRAAPIAISGDNIYIA